MKINRRAFVKYCMDSAELLALDAAAAGKLTQFMTDTREMPTIMWLKGSGCGGCTISLADLVGPETDGRPIDMTDPLTGHVNLVYGKPLMSTTGDITAAQKDAGFILVVEGGIPTAFDGMTCTVTTENNNHISMKKAVEELAPVANGIICIGTCACFGGIVGAAPDPTRIQTVRQLTGIDTLNLPGCPPHPDGIVGSLATVLCGEIPDLDAHGRPIAYYCNTAHPRRPLSRLGYYAEDFDEGECCP